jgi:beta-lactamase class C
MALTMWCRIDLSQHDRGVTATSGVASHISFILFFVAIGPDVAAGARAVESRNMIRQCLVVVGAIALTGSVAIAPLPAQTTSPGATDVERIVSQKVQPMLPQNGGGGGVAVAVRIDGKTAFFNFGTADLAKNRAVTTDSIFNLASVGKLFATTLLAQAVKRGELSLDDPVAKYITELQQGGDIRRVTLGQLASHTSGLPRVPEQYERWHRGKYTFPDFVRFLNAWQADKDHEPGQQDIYSNAALVLLRVALERRFNTPFATLMQQRLTGPLGMTSTALPLPRALLSRAVQGYGPMGRPIGQPGQVQGNFSWPSAGQIFSSARDMATFLAANMGELPDQQPLEDAMALAQQPVFKVNARFTQGLAWQIISAGDITIIDKNGGLPVTSTYIGLAPQPKLGVVVLANRGRQGATKVGRQILHALAQQTSEPLGEGADPD